MQEIEIILDGGDWGVIYNHKTATYTLVDDNTKETTELRLIATLTYTIFDQPQGEIDTLFDNYCCGERVTDDNIIYYWFKEIHV